MAPPRPARAAARSGRRGPFFDCASTFFGGADRYERFDEDAPRRLCPWRMDKVARKKVVDDTDPLSSMSSMSIKKEETKDPLAAGPISFHRRVLPEICVAFSSPAGRALFGAALRAGTAEAYFPLAEQFRTQDEPAYCGLSTLVMVLNALAIDPGRVWKGVWRWFHEGMLSCCKDLALVRSEGVDLAELCCLARCNGAMATSATGVDVDAFRAVVAACCADSERHGFLVVNYDRGVLGQTGTGHFSPVGAYDAESDKVLVLDVARFKYPPHWVALPLLHEAMGADRGYAVMRAGVAGVAAGACCGAPTLGCPSCVLDGFDAAGTGIPETFTHGGLATGGWPRFDPATLAPGPPATRVRVVALYDDDLEATAHTSARRVHWEIHRQDVDAASGFVGDLATSLDLVACRTRRTVFDDFAHCHYLSSDGAPGVVDPATPLAAVAGRTLFVAHDPK